MTGSGRRSVPIGGQPARCPLCYAPLPSHAASCPSRPVSWIENLGEIFPECSPDQVREIQRVLRQAVGSSLTARGGRASRTWSVTGSSGSVSRRLKHARYAHGWPPIRSTSGTASTKTQDSSKLFNVAERTIGRLGGADARHTGE